MTNIMLNAVLGIAMVVLGRSRPARCRGGSATRSRVVTQGASDGGLQIIQADGALQLGLSQG